MTRYLALTSTGGRLARAVALLRTGLRVAAWSVGIPHDLFRRILFRAPGHRRVSRIRMVRGGVLRRRARGGYGWHPSASLGGAAVRADLPHYRHAQGLAADGGTGHNGSRKVPDTDYSLRARSHGGGPGNGSGGTPTFDDAPRGTSFYPMVRPPDLRTPAGILRAVRHAAAVVVIGPRRPSSLRW